MKVKLLIKALAKTWLAIFIFDICAGSTVPGSCAFYCAVAFTRWTLRPSLYVTK